MGAEAPTIVTCYIEIVPTDTIKYEIDKSSGILKVDRPQKFSNICPTPYGFVPQTYCGDEVAAFCMERTGREWLVGDGDPLDICVISEKSIPRGDILLRAIPLGGLRMIDGGMVDDKIIAILEGDAVYGSITEITGLPPELLSRLKHYFLTYKQSPDDSKRIVEITDVYSREEAHEIIRRSGNDYRSFFSSTER